MAFFVRLAFPLIFALSLHAAPLDYKILYELIGKGAKLTVTEAQGLEKDAEAKPEDVPLRVQLLSYYASQPRGVDLAEVKAARARHIIWLIKHDPIGGYGLFGVATGVHRLHCVGDELADPDAFRQVSQLWIEQLRINASNPAMRREAVDHIQYCDPETAERLLIDAKDQSGLGRLYASAALGTTGLSYGESSDPAGSHPDYRKRPFAEKARGVLEASTERDLVVSAAITLLSDGAILWADGKLDWDYTVLGKSLLERAKQISDSMTLLTLPTGLPQPGERPPMTIRVGGNMQAKQLVRKVTPRYPQQAKAYRIQGTVRMTALIGVDGRILGLSLVSGPPELVPASLDAVRQWVYKPTMLNGKPCHVITQIDVNFEFR